MEHFWIILSACLLAVSTALTGTFLVLRKNSMIGDAIAHAVLPGIVIAYMISGSRAGVPLLLGAAMSGVLVTWLIEIIQKQLRLQYDASIGISYTFMFAIGIILVSLYGPQADLDQDCVLYGELAFVPLDTWSLGAFSVGPRQVWILGGLAVISLVALKICYRGLFLSSFDAGFAAATGVHLGIWHYGIMGFTSLDAVLAFEAVGAILVIAFLVGPAATAYLMHTELKKVLAYAVFWGISASILGYGLSYVLDASIAGCMACMIGLQFTLVFLWKYRQRKKSKPTDHISSTIST